jgi:large subunit ribosomal protein L7/L12
MTKEMTRVQKLEEKLKAAKKIAAQKEKAKKEKDLAAAKVKNERRLKLAGTFLLDGATDPGALVNAGGKRLDAWLTSAEDRALFDLPPLA